MVGMGGEDGEELGGSFSAGAGDEDCHFVLFFFIFSFFFFNFSIRYFLGKGEVGFWIEEGRVILVRGRHGRKVSQVSKQSDRMIQVRCDVMR